MEATLILYVQTEVWPLFANTGMVARVVLAILLAFSVVSWAIILQKYWTFRAARRNSDRFLEVFRTSSKFSEIRASCNSLKASPLTGVFLGGYRELENQMEVSENPGKMRLRSLEGVRRALQIACSSEVTRLEKWMGWLATTGAVTPFVGLFGTVWGIIDAFQGLGNAETATLRSVAPGIAEALITTAAGLAAAIPAVIAYNYYLQRVKEFGAQADDFSLEFLNIVERHFA